MCRFDNSLPIPLTYDPNTKTYTHPKYGELSEHAILERIKECYEMPQSDYTYDLYNLRREHLSRVINLGGSIGHPCLHDSLNYPETILLHSTIDYSIPAIELLFSVTRECPQSVYSCMANDLDIINAILGSFLNVPPPTFTLLPAKEMMRRACMLGLKPSASFLYAAASRTISNSCSEDRFKDVCEFIFGEGFRLSKKCWSDHDENCEHIYYHNDDRMECLVYASTTLICKMYNAYVRSKSLFNILSENCSDHASSNFTE